MNYEVVIPAAGQGKRMNAGKNKQFIELEGKPVIAHTLSVFEADPSCTGIILVINEAERDEFMDMIERYSFSKIKKMAGGGAERQESVYNGLKHASEPIVFIHDGARPFIEYPILQELAAAAEREGAATLAVPVKDTIKRVEQGEVLETVERSSLWAVQTPQAFRLSEILHAHEDAELHHYQGTDDASLIERLDKKVQVITGSYANLKLTTPEDLLIADAILKQRKGEKLHDTNRTGI
ncbi:2-C-methyl-D-erythritol 4-phosphate cytidylyltransferase [Metabacillus sp. KIGAM252]|uniref:2-C-methyl-D-erythritol 4-phosphate cytidylyltransferase n=1 Tax=Metabacillus flavus TaxID=2823519 RepID=A0ABS5L9U6_9BACI|nr:2-C-methyl-D-erythritol 4-phosphate cytidylyltransferase [Metabacillus flavus]MBS2967308.1 2-C-methyl-D-erythritol 4-phosphate cytidylyltransferase [Metabacillus flavus]